MHTPLPSWQLVPKSYALTRSHLTPLIYIVLVPALVTTLGSILIGNPVQPNGSIAFNEPQRQGLAIFGLGLVWTAVNAGPMIKLLLDATHHEARPVLDYYRQGWRLSPKVIVCYGLYALAVFGGLLLLIIPGLYALHRFFLAPYFLVDRNSDIITAFKQSAVTTKAYKGPIWGVIGIQFAFTMLSSFLNSIALVGAVLAQLVTLTIVFVTALRYREIASKK